MSSDPWSTIERARKGKRGGSRPRRETQPPHARVICGVEHEDDFLPVLGNLGGIGLDDLFWVKHPGESDKDPLKVFVGEHSPEPEFVVTPGRDRQSASVVTDQSGAVVLSALPDRGRWRTSWTINFPECSAAYTVTERKRDALWRRTITPVSRLVTKLDQLGLVFAIFLLPTLLKPPHQMWILDRDGTTVGAVTFDPDGGFPREDFSLYLDDVPFPLRDKTLALATLAVFQRMK